MVTRNPSTSKPMKAQDKIIPAPASINNQELIPVCIDIEVPEYLNDLSNELSYIENLDNLPKNIEMAAITKKKWCNGRIIKCCFLEGDKTVQDKVVYYAKQWEKYCNIRFNFIEDKYQSEIRISFNSSGGSWSNIGTDCLSISKDEPTLNLGWLNNTSTEDEYSRVVLHEFGHALGLIHEHQNPKENIPWDKEAVYKLYTNKPNNWTRESVDHNIFQKYSTDVTQYSSWDSLSIMHYPVPKELTGGKMEIGWNTKLSETDINFINQLYPIVSPEEELIYIKRLNVLIINRLPTAIEIDSMKNMSRGGCVDYIERSNESCVLVANRLYNNYLNRAPSKKELNDIIDLIQRYITEEQMVSQIVSLDELFIKTGGNKEFIDHVSLLLLNKKVNEEEMSNYLTNISLFGRYHVIYQMTQSEDYRANKIKYFWKNILQREPTIVELNTLVKSNINIRKIRFALEGSNEFFKMR